MWARDFNEIHAHTSRLSNHANNEKKNYTTLSFTLNVPYEIHSFVWFMSLNPVFVSHFIYSTLLSLLMWCLYNNEGQTFANWRNEKKKQISIKIWNDAEKRSAFVGENENFIHYYDYLLLLLFFCWVIKLSFQSLYFDRGLARIFSHWAKMTWQIHLFADQFVRSLDRSLARWFVCSAIHIKVNLFQYECRFWNWRERGKTNFTIPIERK